jgi:hypothetical protein
MNEIFEKFPQIKKKQLLSTSLFNLLYKNTFDAENEWIGGNILNSEPIYYTNKTRFGNITNYQLIDNEIRGLIESIGCFEKKYIFSINHRNYKVYLSYPSKNQRQKQKINDYFEDCIMKIYLWLYVSQFYSRKECSKNMDIFIWFSSHKKIINSDKSILDTLNVNTAFTTSCQENTQICLYRKEEWFKVFIHETFHNLGLDFSESDNTQNDILMEKLFNINNNNNNKGFRVYESYCEVWAEILNCFFNSFIQSENKQQCKRQFEILMKEQITFSVLQLIKILKYYDTNYLEFIDKSKKNIKFQEKTYILSYYILKTILLFYSFDFQSWCIKNNINIFQFRQTSKNIINFGNLIEEKYSEKTFLEYIANMESHLHKIQLNKELTLTMRMTVSP